LTSRLFSLYNCSKNPGWCVFTTPPKGPKCLLNPPPLPRKKTTRRRGAQPDNLNALKHGFYSRHFRSADLKDLDTYQFSGLTDEANLIRIYMRHVVEMDGKEGSSYDPLTILRAICLGSASLNRLLKTQQLIFGPADEASTDLMNVLKEVQKRLAQTLASHSFCFVFLLLFTQNSLRLACHPIPAMIESS
jgi:hypothetical protein